MAMLDGIKNKMHPGEPLDKDIYDLEPEELKDVPQDAADARRGADGTGEGPRVPAAGRRVHRGRDRDLDRVQAREGSGRDPPAAAPVRVRAVLRQLIEAQSRRRLGFRFAESVLHRSLYTLPYLALRPSGA